MTTTYDLALTAARDQVRFRIGDTGDGRWLFQDEEIDHILGLVAQNVLQASWRLVRMALARLAREVDTDGAGYRAARSQKSTQLRELLKDIEKEAMATAVPSFTGASKAVGDALAENDDFPGFGIERGRYG